MEPTLGFDWEQSTQRAATQPSLHLHCRRWEGRQRQTAPFAHPREKTEASLQAAAGSWVIVTSITLITHHTWICNQARRNPKRTPQMANRGAAEAVVLWLLRQGATETAGSPLCLPKLFKSDVLCAKAKHTSFFKHRWGGACTWPSPPRTA